MIQAVGSSRLASLWGYDVIAYAHARSLNPTPSEDIGEVLVDAQTVLKNRRARSVGTFWTRTVFNSNIFIRCYRHG
jgi:hypothetical protein